MNESFLSYLWVNKLFGITSVTTEGEKLKILSVGIQNFDSGPDFSNAKIQIGSIIWSGNVEIHVKSSDWNHHGHQNDSAYNNVILHVVNQNDVEILKQDGNCIPVLVLDSAEIEKLYQKYDTLMKSQLAIPCQINFSKYSKSILTIWLQQLSIRRIEQKVNLIEELLNQLNGNWEDSLFIWLAGGFGMKVNREPFMLLAKGIGIKRCLQNRENLMSLESLFYGQSGLLKRENDDEYSLNLSREYNYLANKYGLIPLSSGIWKFMRLYASSFPTIRISQLCSLLHQNESLFCRILETEKLSDLRQIFMLKASPYWDFHYQFGIESPFMVKQTGKQFIDNLLINCLIPFLFAYGHFQSVDFYKERAVNWLEQIPPEQNSIIRFWKSHSVYAENASQTQALIELKNNYCTLKKCLNCLIGREIMKG